MKHILFLALAAIALTACTQDELAENSTALPEGEYPLQIGSVSLTAEVSEQPWTRVSENPADGMSSVWQGDERIGVRIGDNEETGIYVVKVDAIGRVMEIIPEKAVYWKDDNAQSLLAQVASEMALRGYVRTEEKAEADLGLQLTYVESTTQVSGWVGGSGWGWDSWWYPGFWGPYYGMGWSYGFPVSYSYSTGSMVMEMVDLRNTPADTTEQVQLPVIWQAVSSGLLSGNAHLNLTLVGRAIDQAFTQSSYIKKD